MRGEDIWVAEARGSLFTCEILFYNPFLMYFPLSMTDAPWQQMIYPGLLWFIIRVSDKSFWLSGEDLTDNNRLPLAPTDGSSSNSLPTEQQNAPTSSGVAPAVAGRTPSNSARPTSQGLPLKFWLAKLLFQLLLVSSNFRRSLYAFTL